MHEVFGVEVSAMGWSATYFSQVKGIDGETAAAYASLVFIGITAGRFVGGIALLLLPIQNETLSIIAFVIIGLGYAPIYPCIIHATPNNFGAENSDYPKAPVFTISI